MGPSARRNDWLLMDAEEGVSSWSAVCVPTVKPTVPHPRSCGWLWISSVSQSQSKTESVSVRKGLVEGRGWAGVGTDERRWTGNDQNASPVSPVR